MLWYRKISGDSEIMSNPLGVDLDLGIHFDLGTGHYPVPKVTLENIRLLGGGSLYPLPEQLIDQEQGLPLYSSGEFQADHVGEEFHQRPVVHVQYLMDPMVMN